MEKHQGRRKKPRKKTYKSSVQPIQYLLESGTLANMRAAKRVTAAILKYQWDFYSELAYQRNNIADQISHSLNVPCRSYAFSQWQRAVKFKYSLHPLSTVGSLTYIGGRFNMGVDINTQIPIFPGLYLAQDKDTALQEHLGQETIPSNSKLTARELALSNPTSETIVSVSGKLDKVFDLTNPENLQLFVDLIKTFKLSTDLKRRAKELRLEIPRIAEKVDELHKTLLHPDWRQLPVGYDIPSNSQIFGHLIYSAGIEGILYPSKFTKKPCLIVFSRNFIETDSYVVLDDDAPHETVPRRIDSKNWRITEMDIKEITRS
ncbi:MAG: StPS1 gp25 [Gammaproteobacteria bacterium]|jgi:hypothetical protein|nr:StPS1 gp25 [Gammaproteobacteria bacterium]